MVLTVQFQINLRIEPFVPSVKVNKLLQHSHGKPDEREAPVSEYQFQLGHVRWAN